MVKQEDMTREFELVFEHRQAVVLSKMITAAYTDLVKTGDFNELKAIVGRLAEAQERTELRMEELAEAQERTEHRVEELAEAQKRTEHRVEELAEAQKRTEQRVEELADAQERTEQRVGELSVAQTRTEDNLTKLTQAVDRLAKQVGGLSNAFGGDIEDIAYIVIHDVLQREFGWKVDVLQRQWQTWGKEPEEVNIFGQAIDPAHPEHPIWIVGEAKYNLTTKEVEKFLDQLGRARLHLSGEILPVCFCYRARPEVQEMIRDADVRLVFSYGKLV